MGRVELEVADVFRRHGATYREKHDGTLGRARLRVMRAIELCRTAALGGHVEQCDACAHRRVAYNSCRNRHCPKCQALARALWLEARKADLLPVPYFHVVFTLPEAIAAIALQNKRTVYDILFRSTAATLRTIAADPRHLGAEIGFVAVLHTWGQTLQHHPHLHCIVPGGGLAPDGQRWVACRPGFFLPVRVLSSLFRRLFLEALDQAFRAGELVFRGSLVDLNEAGRFAEQLQTARGIDWVVYAKPPFGGPEQVLDYLGRYTHRVAISNSRLTEIGDSTVSFGWKDYRHHDRRKVMTLDAHEFIRRFLLHVLPDGFQRIRHYGLLGNRGRQAKLARCRQLLDAPPPTPPVLALLADPHDRYQALTGRSLHVCQVCSAGTMRRVEILPATVGRSTRPAWADTSWCGTLAADRPLSDASRHSPGLPGMLDRLRSRQLRRRYGQPGLAPCPVLPLPASHGPRHCLPQPAGNTAPAHLRPTWDSGAEANPIACAGGPRLSSTRFFTPSQQACASHGSRCARDGVKNVIQ